MCISEEAKSEQTQRQQSKLELRIENATMEQDYFILTVLGHFSRLPPFSLPKLQFKDMAEMYERAKLKNISFAHFNEWITNDLK